MKFMVFYIFNLLVFDCQFSLKFNNKCCEKFLSIMVDNIFEVDLNLINLLLCSTHNALIFKCKVLKSR